MRKRIVAALLAAVLALGLAAPALAAGTAVSEDEAAQVLAALDIMTGVGGGELRLDRTITRAELTKMAVAASVYKDSVGDTASVSPYPDVARTAWYAPYVELARDQGLVMGDTAGYFRPEWDIRLSEAVTIVLRLLGYQDSDFSGAWPSGQMALYRALGLDAGVSAGQEDAITRRDALYLFYNLLTAQTKSGQVYLTTLGHSLTSSGEIDRVALVNSAMEGPLVAEGDWQSAIPFQLNENVKVYRNGVESTLSAIREGDVVYYSASLYSLWAWSSQVTGTYTAATPSASAPTSVTVGGKTYAIETADAAYALSDLGAFRIGDTVTLLLGRNGGVAAVRAPGEGSTVVYGVVNAITTDTYQDANGNTYTDDAVAVTATDGVTRTYPFDGRYLQAGDPIRVTVAGEGYDITRMNAAPLTGRVNDDGTAIGMTPLASDVEILDTYGTSTAAVVYPGRLAGVTLSGDMVRWYGLNERGEVAWLILDDVTGDLHQYGVLTSVSEVSGANPTVGFLMNAAYVYDVGGTTRAHTSTTTLWNLHTGPCQVKSDGLTLDRIYNLTEVELTGVDGNVALSGNRRYTLSESVAVYEVRDGDYYLTSLDRVTGGDYTLTGWYDKAESAGGRIRVVLARAR